MSAKGPIPDRIHRFPLRVYWEDTDAGGIVYHSNYLNFAERARTEFVRGLGIRQSDLAAGGKGHALAVSRAEIDFVASARLDDSLEVASVIHRVGGATVNVHQVIIRLDDGAELVRLNIRLGFISLESGKPARLPAGLRRSLLDYASERQE